MVLLPSSDKVASHQQSSWLIFSISIRGKPYGLWIKPLGLGPSLSAPRDWVEASPSPRGCASGQSWVLGSHQWDLVLCLCPLFTQCWDTHVPWRGQTGKHWFGEEPSRGQLVGPPSHMASPPQESLGHLCSQSSQLHRGGGRRLSPIPSNFGKTPKIHFQIMGHCFFWGS